MARQKEPELQHWEVLFLPGGVTLRATADSNRMQMTMFAGIRLWRMGEAVIDVTDAPVPADVLQSLRPSKPLVFFCFRWTWILLIAASHLHIRWLYFAFLGGMCLGVLLWMLLLTEGWRPRRAFYVESHHNHLGRP